MTIALQQREMETIQAEEINATKKLQAKWVEQHIKSSTLIISWELHISNWINFILSLTRWKVEKSGKQNILAARKINSVTPSWYSRFHSNHLFYSRVRSPVGSRSPRLTADLTLFRRNAEDNSSRKSQPQNARFETKDADYLTPRCFILLCARDGSANKNLSHVKRFVVRVTLLCY